MTMTASSLRSRAHDGGVADDTDPAPRPKRRSFDAGYRRQILAEYEALPKHGPERGALLRREGLYTSHIAEWRNAARRAADAALEPKVRGPKTSPAVKELAKANERIKRLEAELARTKTALEITGKVHALLEQLSESAATETWSKP